MDEESKRRWEALERDLAQLLRARRTPGSGSKRLKGDVQGDLWLAEAKYRSGPSPCCLVLRLDWLETAWNQAMAARKIPLLALEWGNGARVILIAARDYYQTLGPDVAMPHQCISQREWLLCAESLELPLSVSFPGIQVPELNWVIVDWAGMRELVR